MSRYQQLKLRAHRHLCDQMRFLDWKEEATAEQLLACALSFYQTRHRMEPKYKRPRKPSSKLKTVSRPKEKRRMAIHFLVRRELIEDLPLFT